MGAHRNPDCPHADLTISRVKAFYEADDPYGLLQEAHRLRSAGPALSDHQRAAIELHEIGALATIGAISIEEFLSQTDSYTDAILASGGSYFLADVRLWRMELVTKAKRLDLARKLVARFYESIPRTADVEVFGDMSIVYLYEAEGEMEEAIGLCRVTLEGVDRSVLSCLYEYVARVLARLLVRRGDVESARAVLQGAGMPGDRIDEDLA